MIRYSIILDEKTGHYYVGTQADGEYVKFSEVQSYLPLSYVRPSVEFKPRLFIDGDKWCALYGDNLQDGIAGFGDSPDLAMRNFDENWCEKLSDKWMTELSYRKITQQ